MDAAAAGARPTARPAPTTRYADALERWLALGGADLDERADEAAAELGLGVDLDAPMTGAVRRPGRPGGARRAAAVAASTSSCSTSPPTTSTWTASSGWSSSSPACAPAPSLVSHDREFLARTVTRVVELDLAQQQVERLRRRLRGVPGRARGRPAARPRGVRGVRRHARPAGGRGPGRSATGWTRACATPCARRPDNDKIGRKFRAETSREAGRQGPPDRADDRAAGGGRGAAQGVGAADGRSPRRRAPARSWRRCAARSSGAGTSPSARSTCRSTGPTGSPSPAPTARASPRCWPRCSAGSPLDEGTAALGPGVRGRRGRPGPGPVPRRRTPLLDAFGDAGPDLARADVRTLLAKFGLTADHVLRPAATALAGRAHPRRAGAAAGPRGEPAGARRADQPPRPARDRAAGAGAGRRTPARCCSSRTTAACSKPCTPPGGGSSPRVGSPSAERGATVEMNTSGIRARPNPAHVHLDAPIPAAHTRIPTAAPDGRRTIPPRTRATSTNTEPAARASTAVSNIRRGRAAGRPAPRRRRAADRRRSACRGLGLPGADTRLTAGDRGTHPARSRDSPWRIAGLTVRVCGTHRVGVSARGCAPRPRRARTSPVPYGRRDTRRWPSCPRSPRT